MVLRQVVAPVVKYKNRLTYKLEPTPGHFIADEQLFIGRREKCTYDLDRTDV